jgi:hypothetical protein
MILASSQAPLHGKTQTPSGISHMNGTGKLIFSAVSAPTEAGINKKKMANKAILIIIMLVIMQEIENKDII